MNKKPIHYHVVRIATIVIALGIVGGLSWAGASAYLATLPPGVTFHGQSIGGVSATAAQKRITNIESTFGTVEVTLQLQGSKSKPLVIEASVGGAQGVFISAEQTRKRIAEYQRAGFPQRFATYVQWFFTRPGFDVNITLQQDNVQRQVAQQLSDFGISQNATFGLNEGRVTLIPEQSGVTVDYNRIASDIQKNVRAGSRKIAVAVSLQNQLPEITTEKLSVHLARAQRFLDNEDFTLKTETQSVTRADEEVVGILAEVFTQAKNTPSLDAFIARVATEVNAEKVDAVFEQKDGKVIRLEPGKDGVVVDIASTRERIMDGIRAGEGTVTLVTQIDSAKTLGEVNTLGITEILGVGKSSADGSTKTRMHNVQLGADLVNGTIVLPGETFSLIDALGPIDKKHGFLPELVIKGNQVIPEDGGGLCQIGTTLFRGVLQAGLPMTERRNHSFRVQYYEPVGTDCTIYTPKPDCRFKNDTQHAVVIMTKITGFDIEFTFWGTKDGRVVNVEQPKILTQGKAPATKYVETTDLAPGVEKCSGSNVGPVTTSLSTTVTYPSGEKRNDVFKSAYKSWYRICLVGKKS